MKTFTFIFIFISIFYIAGNSQTIGDKLREISEDSKYAEKDVNEIVKNLFNDIDNALEESQNLAEQLKKINALSSEDRKAIKDKIKNIHETFKRIATDKTKYEQSLINCGANVTTVVKKAEDLRNQELNLLNSKKKELQNNTDEDKKPHLEIQISIIQQKVQILNEFSKEASNFEGKYNSQRENIRKFLKQVEYSSTTTYHMLDLVDLVDQAQVILDNLNKLGKLDEYIERMHKTLEQLSKSLTKMSKLSNSTT